MMRINLQPAFVLHTRAFRDTSLIVDVLTPEHGRVSGVARGARGQRSKFKGYLRPFVPVLLSWTGRSDLMTFTQIEPNGPPYFLEGNDLLAAMYLNELLVKLVHRFDPLPDLYDYYQRTLEITRQAGLREPVLRQFEKFLLVELGYGFDWLATADTGEAISPEKYYAFAAEQGFMAELAHFSNQPIFAGNHILAIAQDDYSDKAVLRAAKQIMRKAIAAHLAGATVKSRELFV